MDEVQDHVEDRGDEWFDVMRVWFEETAPEER